MIPIRTLFKPLAHVPVYPSREENIERMPDPDYVLIPLEYPGQIFYKPTVKQDDAVRKNQIIGRSELGNCVHASISGVVKEIKPIWSSRSFNVPAVVIERNDHPPLSRDELFAQSGVPFQSASRLEKLKVSGAISPWTLPGRHHQEEDVREFPPIRKIIIKGADEEPTLFAFELLLRQEAEDILSGLKHLQQLAPNAAIFLTMSRRLAGWGTEKYGKHAAVVGLSDAYKDRIERRVVAKITGSDIPNILPYRKMGVAVLSVEYLLTMDRALEGEGPFIHKYLTIAGRPLEKAVTVRAPIGTPIRTILENRGIEKHPYARILVGGAMKGNAQFSDQTPITKSSHGLFLMDRDEIPEEINLTCINCGRCTRACPVCLQVHLIGRYVEYSMFEKAREFHPEACHECGLCAYVCPAHRPMAQLMRMAKQYEV